jgi:hypothetical protein
MIDEQEANASGEVAHVSLTCRTQRTNIRIEHGRLATDHDGTRYA